MNSTARHAFLSKAEDEAGYPNMAFEYFYQYGLDCFYWRLPRYMVRRAFERACVTWQSKRNIAVWQIKAFIHGMRGQGADVGTPFAQDDYTWPTPPDPSWTMVACIYPGNLIDLDLVHEVSRRFWSEDNGFIELPRDDGRRLSRSWFERMGIDIMVMQPEMAVGVAAPKRHLNVV